MKESIESTVVEEVEEVEEKVENPATENATSENATAENEKKAAPKEKIDEEKVITEFPADMFDIKRKPVYEFFKRLIDIVVSLIAIIVLLPFGLILALIIVCDSPGKSPIHVRKRCGKYGKKFKFYKFRSMVPNAEELEDELENRNEMDGNAFKIENDDRITRVGKVIRKYSIDELPQFINVLKGDMSIVGPRPPLIKQVYKYTDDEKIRLAIKPGLTCYWQTMPKRNKIAFKDWVALDVKYINERSLWTDIKIFFKTFGAMFGAEGC